MIINNKHKFVYIGIIKSGSETLHKFFGGLPGSKNPQTKTRPPLYRHHSRVPPRYAETYDVIVSIRDPYNRLASLYHMAHRRKMVIPHKSFEEMIDFLIESLDPKYDDDYVRFRCLPIHRYLEPIQNVKHIIKLENILEDINSLPYFDKPVKLPHVNRSGQYTPFEKLITPRILDKVNYWAGKDFELYGYTKL